MTACLTYRPYICYILYRLTTENEVKKHRIHKLYVDDGDDGQHGRTQLLDRVGKEPPLLHLLMAYKEFNRDDVFLPKVSARMGSNPWKQAGVKGLREIAVDGDDSNERSSRKRDYNTTVTASLSRGGVDIPDYTYNNEPKTSSLSNPLSRFSFIHLGKSSQMVGSWLSSMLDELFFAPADTVSSAKQTSSRQTVLRGILSFTEYIGEAIPVVEAFLYKYLPRWDGIVHFRLVMGMLSYVPPMPYESLYDDFLVHIQRIYMMMNSRRKVHTHE